MSTIDSRDHTVVHMGDTVRDITDFSPLCILVILVTPVIITLFFIAAITIENYLQVVP